MEKRVFAVLLAIIILLQICGCSKPTKTPTENSANKQAAVQVAPKPEEPEEPSADDLAATPIAPDESEPTESKNDDAGAVEMLYNVFGIDGIDVDIQVDGNTIDVFLGLGGLDSLRESAFSGDEDAKSSINTVLDQCLKIHNNARVLLASFGDYELSTTLCNSDMPLASFTDGEVTFDFWTID